MTKNELDEILRKHGMWLNGQEGRRAYLNGASLRRADLSNANLVRANLSSANLRGANLRGASLQDANLQFANLSSANLRDANLSGADLRGANLIGANLRGANLRGANLSSANLRDVNLSGADLRGADLSGSIGGPPYYSISWGGHGEMGRRLHAVEQDGRLVFSCGCFSGSESHLREYIKDGNKEYAESRLRALEIILELHDSTLGLPTEDGE